MGPKDAPCEHPSPAKAFAPAPSAFALPRPRSHFPRPRSHFPRIAFHFPRGAIGLPQQQLSTMGYPRKSYPHCCSPPCAKRSRPRACARVYIIYRSPSRRSPGVFAPLRKRVRAVVPPCPAPPCAGWGGRRQRRTPPRAVPALARLRPSPCPSTAESLCAKAECTRQSSPLPVRSPRVSPHTTELPPAYGRITVRKGGSAQGNPRPCPCVLPATARLRPSPCLLMGESLCAKAEVHKANPAPARAFSPRQLVYGRAPARLWSNCRAQRRKCTRPTPPPPVRSPRVSLSTAALPPADGRSAERRVGEDEGKGGRPLAQQPAPVCLPPRPRRLNGHPASAGGRENDRMAHRRTTTPTHRTQRGNDTCTIRVP